MTQHTSPHALLERIVIVPGLRSGKPTIRGTRITVGDVLDMLVAGVSEDSILADFPQLERADLRACLAFAAARERGHSVAGG